MCNLFVCTRPPSTTKYSLILLFARDERFARVTEKATWRNGVLSGIDLQDKAKGTWFGVNKAGKIGALLSITQQKREDIESRGTIPMQYLQCEPFTTSFCNDLLPRATKYNGFTFIALEKNRTDEYFDMHSVTNALVPQIEVTQWLRGTYVLGNCPPHKTYKKMERGKELFNTLLSGLSSESTDDDLITQLIEMGSDSKQCWPDEQLESQLTAEIAPFLSSLFVRTPIYGTLCQTALLIDKDGRTRLHERRLESISEQGEEWASQDFTFDISKIK